MEELKKIIEALGRAFEEFKAANDARLKAVEAKGAADPLLVEKVEKANADISSLLAMKAQLERLETVVARAPLPGGSLSAKDAAKAEHATAFDAMLRRGAVGDLAALEVKAELSSSVDPSGGYTVPEQLSTRIMAVAQTASVMRQLATVETMTSDTYKELVDQGGESYEWVGEKESRSTTDTPTLAQIIINAKEISAKPKTTQNLLDDSSWDVAAWLARRVGIGFSAGEGDAFIDGDGVSKPRGILGYTGVADASYAWGSVGYIATGAASTFTNADKLFDVQGALKVPYQNGAAWVMKNSTFQHIRQFKTGDAQYLWRPGLEAGAPNTLLGKPVYLDDNMPAIGAGNYVCAYGDFRQAYLILDRQGIRVLRDPYSAKPYVEFYTTARVGGGIVMFEALKLLKVAAS